MNTSTTIFTYGSLKRGNIYHQYFMDNSHGGATFAGMAQTVEKYPLIVDTDFKVPYALCSPGNGKVRFGHNDTSLPEHTVVMYM